MVVDVTVLRVFTDAEGNFGNALGIIDANTAAPADFQRIAAELGGRRPRGQRRTANPGLRCLTGRADLSMGSQRLDLPLEIGGGGK
jgi:hypothetical protein